MSNLNHPVPFELLRQIRVTADALGVPIREAAKDAWGEWVAKHRSAVATALGIGVVPLPMLAKPAKVVAKSPMPPSPAVVEVVALPVADKPGEVVARTASVEPGMQLDPWATADEVLRLGGVAGSVRIGASATISGAAVFTVESE